MGPPTAKLPGGSPLVAWLERLTSSCHFCGHDRVSLSDKRCWLMVFL